MARPVEFDRQIVIEKAMTVFWRKGYNATSLSDLLEATALNRGSLYAAFGNKRGLFLETLECYMVQRLTRMSTVLNSQESARAGIEHLFQTVIQESLQDDDGYCCLMVNTILELTAHDREIVDHIGQMMQQVQHLLAQAIIKAQQQGDVDPHRDAEGLAAFLITGLQGIRVMTQTKPNRTVLEAVIDNLLLVLDKPTKQFNQIN